MYVGLVSGLNLMWCFALSVAPKDSQGRAMTFRYLCSSVRREIRMVRVVHYFHKRVERRRRRCLGVNGRVLMKRTDAST